MLQEPFADGLYVKDSSLWGADRVLERLETGGAEVEGKSLEVCSIWGFLIDV